MIGTRGEGGQNETGPELYNELGVLRTFEQLAAAGVTGAQVSFLNLPEFGYSKTREETFEHWGREETVRRLVRAIRAIRPDVIITHHDAETGHGHHQALGAAALDAFDAAADPNAFPELAGPASTLAGKGPLCSGVETQDPRRGRSRHQPDGSRQGFRMPRSRPARSNSTPRRACSFSSAGCVRAR